MSPREKKFKKLSDRVNERILERYIRSKCDLRTYPHVLPGQTPNVTASILIDSLFPI